MSTATATAPRARTASASMKFDVANLKLADAGARKIAWAGEQMDVLASIRERFSKAQPLKGIRLAACLHVTAETANLMLALKAGGAQLALCASNPLSTQDDVAAALVQRYKIPTFAVRGEDRTRYYRHITAVLDTKPHITIDAGADLVSTIQSTRQELAAGIIGGTEETTTGVIRLRSLEAQGLLKYPIIAVNDADTKHLFDNRYGTGQSTIDGVIRATNRLLAGSRFVVAGYGWCGKGLARRAAGMGAQVIVTEVDAVKALEAVMDGFQVMPMSEAAKIGEIFVTVTGNTSVIRAEHLQVMPDGAIISNSGHFDVEIDLEDLRKMSTKHEELRPGVVAYTLKNRRRINVLGEGRLVNLACAEGHPPTVMDLSFADQALASEFLVQNAKTLKRQVYVLPAALDQEVARLKLAAMGARIDQLTPKQRQYLASWQSGT